MGGSCPEIGEKQDLAGLLMRYMTIMHCRSLQA